MNLRRREVLPVLALAPWLGAAEAAPLARGDAVSWPGSVSLLDGSSWSAEQWRDRAAVIVFWSLHCGFCERHNVHVEKLYRAAAGKRLNVLSVVAELDADAVRRRMAQRGWTFPVTLGREPLAAALGARRSVPLTVTVDRKGRLSEAIPGEMFEADVLDLLKLAAAA